VRRLGSISDFPARVSLPRLLLSTSRRTVFNTSSVQPRWVTEISDNGLTRRNCARTSAGEVITTLSLRDNVAQASRLPSDEFDGRAGETPALLCGGDRIVVTTAMRASAGTRFNAMLHPIQPARRAVDESGLRLMMAEGGKAKLGTSRRLWTRSRPLARPSRAFAFSQIPFAVSQTAQVNPPQPRSTIQSPALKITSHEHDHTICNTLLVDPRSLLDCFSHFSQTRQRTSKPGQPAGHDLLPDNIFFVPCCRQLVQAWLDQAEHTLFAGYARASHHG